MSAFEGKANEAGKATIHTVAEDPIAWLLVLVLLLCSFDLLLASDIPLRIGVLFFLGAVFYRRSWDFGPVALLLFFLFVVSPYYPSWVWRIPTAGFYVPLALCGTCCLPFTRLRAGFAWAKRGELNQVVSLRDGAIALGRTAVAGSGGRESGSGAGSAA